MLLASLSHNNVTWDIFEWFSNSVMRELQELLAKVKETFNSLTQKTFKSQKFITSHSLRKVPNFSLFKFAKNVFDSLTHPVKNNMLYMHLDYIFVTATLANISKKRHVFYGRPTYSVHSPPSRDALTNA